MVDLILLHCRMMSLVFKMMKMMMTKMMMTVNGVGLGNESAAERQMHLKQKI